MPHTRPLLVFCVLLVCSGVRVNAQVAANTVVHERTLEVDLGWDRGRFVVAHPEAERSSARRLGDDLIDKRGHVPPATEGYTLTSDVIVVSADPEWHEQSGWIAEPVEGLEQVWVMHTPSIAYAIATAEQLSKIPKIEAAYVNAMAPWGTRSEHALEGDDDDPMLARQWTLHNASYPGADARVFEAWAQGFSGAGVVIGLVEREVDTTHPDLAGRLRAALSMPVLDPRPDDHSTAVAGVAVGERNGIGMVGAAPGAGLATMPVGDTLQTIRALLYERDRVAIKLGTWGRSDHDRMTRLDPATREALAEVAKTSVIVWAAGNGGPDERIDHDAWVSNRAVLPVTAVGDLDLRATYDERGSAHLVCAHSSGNARSVIAPLSGGTWTKRFGGTSAAAPLAAGVIALALEANPRLGQREIEHLLVRTARVLDERSGLWHANAAGVSYSELHGFGAVNADALVKAAQHFEPLEPMTEWSSGVRTVDAVLDDPQENDQEPSWTTIEFEGPTGLKIEHVEVVLNVRTDFVGDLSVELRAPAREAGQDPTLSVLASPRNDAQDDLRNRVFLSRKHWGERSDGVWVVRLADMQPGDAATWQDVELRMTGTRIEPVGGEE